LRQSSWQIAERQIGVELELDSIADTEVVEELASDGRRREERPRGGAP
jgi:hypothetical protein